MNTKRGTASDKTRDAIRKAFYARNVLDTEKQFAFAEILGFDVSAFDGSPVTQRSFLNLSESDAQKLVKVLASDECATEHRPPQPKANYYCPKCHSNRCAYCVRDGLCNCGAVVRSFGAISLATKEK